MLSVVNAEGGIEFGSLIDGIVREALAGCSPPLWSRKSNNT